jgi:hypothetical protein
VLPAEDERGNEMSVVDDSLVLSFGEAVCRFCGLFDSKPRDREQWKQQLAVCLGDLYCRAQRLPVLLEVPVKSLDAARTVSEADWQRVFNFTSEMFGVEAFYWQYSDLMDTPSNNEEPECASIADDMADIYRDLRPGLDLLSAGENMASVIAIWKYPSFGSHWGRHALGAMRLLHEVVYAGHSNDGPVLPNNSVGDDERGGEDKRE